MSTPVAWRSLKRPSFEDLQFQVRNLLRRRGFEVVRTGLPEANVLGLHLDRLFGRLGVNVVLDVGSGRRRLRPVAATERLHGADRVLRAGLGQLPARRGPQRRRPWLGSVQDGARLGRRQCRDQRVRAAGVQLVPRAQPLLDGRDRGVGSGRADGDGPGAATGRDHRAGVRRRRRAARLPEDGHPGLGPRSARGRLRLPRTHPGVPVRSGDAPDLRRHARVGRVCSAASGISGSASRGCSRCRSTRTWRSSSSICVAVRHDAVRRG